MPIKTTTTAADVCEQARLIVEDPKFSAAMRRATLRLAVDPALRNRREVTVRCNPPSENER